MGRETKIEYCDSTVNPIMGCTGCELYHPNPEKNHCYAADLCRRRAGQNGWPMDFSIPTHFPGRLEKAIRFPDLTGTWRREKPWLDGLPRIIFVNDLGDGFCPHPSADPDAWLAPHLSAMAASPHIYLLLTKWPGRMHRFVRETERKAGQMPDNILWGVTITSPKTRVRAEVLLRIQRVRRWISAEPLLEETDLSPFVGGLEFLAAGGESGGNARWTHPRAFRRVREDCLEVGAPFFFKQWGEWIHESQKFPAPFPSGPENYHYWPDGSWSMRVGKKRAGRLLDGREWNEFPA